MILTLIRLNMCKVHSQQDQKPCNGQHLIDQTNLETICINSTGGLVVRQWLDLKMGSGWGCPSTLGLFMLVFMHYELSNGSKNKDIYMHWSL